MKPTSRVLTLAMVVVLAACGGSSDSGSGTADTGGGGGHDTGSSGLDAALDGRDTGSSGGDSSSGGETDATTSDTDDTSTPPVDAPATFGTTCAPGSVPTITGTVYAPNGTDPVPGASVYAPITVNAFKPGVSCDTCDIPIDTYWSVTTTAADGTFTLDLTGVPASATVKIASRKGRFRKVSSLAVACGPAIAAPKTATTLPGTTPTGDDSMPKIAVGSGNSDHLDTILSALGIVTFDCFEGRKTTTSTNCPTAEATGKRVSALLTDATSLNQYNLLFLSCAPGVWASYSSADQATIVTNLTAWVNAGGRLIATDNSYDYVSQSWQSDISWQGPTGTPWPVDGANVGDVPSTGSTYTATVDDPALVAWLKVVGFTSAPSVDISGWLHNWSVQASIPTTTTEVAHGTVGYTYPLGGTSTSADLPLTSEFTKNKCGRVIYSSYHTLPTVSASSLTAQEKILEYLILDVAACLRIS
jgi:hypothetical protein